MSKWVGESEQNISRLFDRARENQPSIVFIDEIDEIDAIAPRRGQLHVHDSHVNQLLSEIDGISGQQGVLVVRATNRPDQLDPALYSARTPTVEVDLEALAVRRRGGHRPT